MSIEKTKTYEALTLILPEEKDGKVSLQDQRKFDHALVVDTKSLVSIMDRYGNRWNNPEFRTMYRGNYQFFTNMNVHWIVVVDTPEMDEKIRFSGLFKVEAKEEGEAERI